VGPVRIDDERSEPLVALQGFPEKDQHLRCPLDRLLAAGKVSCRCLHLINDVSKVLRLWEWDNYRLIENPGHAVNQKLEILRPVQTTKIVAIVVLGWISTAIFWDRI
jgi:hypothetical protein